MLPLIEKFLIQTPKVAESTLNTLLRRKIRKQEPLVLPINVVHQILKLFIAMINN